MISKYPKKTSGNYESLSPSEENLNPERSTDNDSLAKKYAIDKKISDELYNKTYEILGKDRIVDLVGILGYYTLISMTINVFGVQHSEMDSPYMDELESEIEI